MEMTLVERTLVIIKPDAIQRGLFGEIISRFEKKGLKIVAIRMLRLCGGLFYEHYSHLKDKPFFNELREFMEKTPVIAAALEGFGAVAVVRGMVGDTNGRLAGVGTIRGDYSVSNQANLIHASDSLENAQIEIKRFFAESSIYKYDLASLPFLYSRDEQ